MVGVGPAGLQGRETEFSVLDRAFRSARDGHGSAVLLVGPPGMGKSALLRAARVRARRAGLTAATSWCWREGAPPLWPWLDLLAQLGYPVKGGRDLAAEGFDGFREVERALSTAAVRQPLLLALDDLHEGDEATVLLTRYLAPRMIDLPAVLLLTRRPLTVDTDSERAGELLADVELACDVIRLAPLPPAAVAELAAAHGHRLPPSAADALAVASGGVPLYAISALRDLPSGATHVDLDVGVLRRLRLLTAEDARIVVRAAVLGPVIAADVVAAVCGVERVRVAGAAAAARAAGLVRYSAGEVTFEHELVRTALVGFLDREEVVAMHAAAAAHYHRNPQAAPGAVARAARHALEAAERSAADAAAAVALTRRAAAELVAGGAPDDAVELLDRAAAANELAGLPVARSRLLLERAASVLVAGRLAAAHDYHAAAVDAALADGDEIIVAEAAAGLGALWVNTVRSPVEQRRILRTQRRALERLPEGHRSLRLRLRARIAAEAMFWEGAPPEALLEVVGDVRVSGDVPTVLEVLSVAHNPLLAPEYTDLRLQLSEEMLALAAHQPPGSILELMALCWRTVDLLLAGDGRAERALADLREPAEATQSLSVLYIVRVMEVTLLIRQGRLDEAEQAAHAAYELGVRAQDADSVSYLGGQLSAIRWLQGREGELLDMLKRIAASANLDGVDHSFEAGTAVVAARMGRLDVARRQLHRLTRDDLATLPRFSTWLVTLTSILEAAAILGDGQTVAATYGLLEPFGALPVAPSLAVTCFGCVHRWLGIGALALGQYTMAERHLREAVEGNLRLGHEPATAVVRAELAAVLADHNPSPGRTAEARALYAAAAESADQLGMSVLADRWRVTANRLQGHGRVRITRRYGAPKAGWTVEFAGRRSDIRDLVGMRYLAVLTASPGRWIGAAELVSDAPTSPSSSHQPLLDAQARRSLEQRVRELAARVAEARERGDATAQAVAEEELDGLAAHLAEASAFGGRPRAFADGGERARTAVRKAVIRAVEEIAAVDDVAGAHLRARVETGSRCRYDA
ncbi:ATP-binding protein [Pseudonocardia charpentierae]|uniref:ATP-binding protein n=1 Tax=Pseudonocardia charpentierae TaxID=3075545 RepID=A0ABU2NKR4_9PSEU|nr:ATP-binding protein [Pseudonocardia sp. DSM 45834]MDT0353603.1 ATP-binding protein [Pseudonocardia sp. DSM 45834]